MKKILLFLGIGLLSCNLSFGQDAATPDQKMLPSNSGGLNSSLGNMLSPNLFDGSTTIAIPIYQYGNFGISLNYNTKGVTMEELSGPVGIHWNLNAGGSITRAMKDFPDELEMPYTGNSSTYNYYDVIGRQLQYSRPSKNNNEYWDGQNDEFMVSAGPLNFTFKMGKDGFYLKYPQNNCKITPDVYVGNGGTLRYEHFTITDENGNKYYFGAGEETKGNYTTGNTNLTGGGYSYVSKWDLDSVQLADGGKITYDYKPFTYPQNIDLYHMRTQADSADGNSGPFSESFVTQNNVSDYGYNLMAIHYPGNTTVNFVFDQPDTDAYAECQKSIKQIEINQGDGQCKKYRFNKTYFIRVDDNNNTAAEEMPFDNACNYNDYDERLMLKSIDILSCDELTAQNYYSFEYSTTVVPNRYGNNRDFFGYCNGIVPGYNDLNNLINEIPTHRQAFSTAYGADPSNKANSTDANIIAAISLTKMKNAYGGSLSFQYETHTGLVNEIPGLPDPNSDHLFMGLNAVDGLRLHAVVMEDTYHPGGALTTTYTYSGGQFFLNGGYFGFPSGVDANGNINLYTNTTAWVSSHQLINGSNHGYSQVTATQTANGTVLSSTKYYFSNFSDNGVLRQLITGSTVKRNYFNLPYSDKQYIKDWEMGLPVKTEEFDQFGNILSRTTNFYSSHIDSTSAVLGLGKNMHTLRVIPPPGNNPTNVLTLHMIASDTFTPYSGISLLDSTFTQKFVNSTTSINDTTRYTYDDRHNVSYIITRNSKGEYYRLQNIYNYNITGSSILSNMTNSGLELKIGMERWKQASKTPSSSDLLLDANITRYQYQNDKIWTQKLHTLQSLQPIPYNTYTASGTNPYGNIITSYNTPTQSLPNFQLSSEVLQFDGKGNPTETQLLGQDVYKSMIWDTLTGQKTAEVNNARLQDIGYTSFEVYVGTSNYTGQETFTDGGFKFKEGGLQLGVADNMSGHNTYKLTSVNVNTAGITTPTLRNSQQYVVSFWAKGGTPTLSGAGISVSLIAGHTVNGWTFYQGKFTPASNGVLTFATNANTFFDELRLFPSNATMQTTVYAPMVGKTSETDLRGNITYYLYDALGRQTAVEDQDRNITSKKTYHIGQ